MTGLQFGRLTVLEQVPRISSEPIMWKCKCNCLEGNIVNIRGGDLRSGKTKSCGCIRKEISIGDLTGKRFGRLLVLREAPKKNNRPAYVCKCDCDGKEIIVIGKSLHSGNTKSCGCINFENSKLLGSIIFNKYDLSREYGIGYTNNGKEFYFDIEDYEKIKDVYWHITDKGYVSTKTTLLPKNLMLMHRYLTNCDSIYQEVDHINGKTNDNRKTNLRVVDKQKNQMNTGLRKDNKTGVKGVSYHETSSTYRAYIQYKNKFTCLGYHRSKEKAIRIRELAELKLFGEYSRRYEELKEKYKDVDLEKIKIS